MCDAGTQTTNESDFECAICLNSCDAPRYPSLTFPCGHEFHTGCAINVRENGENNVPCPLCRRAYRIPGRTVELSESDDSPQEIINRLVFGREGEPVLVTNLAGFGVVDRGFGAYELQFTGDISVGFPASTRRFYLHTRIIRLPLEATHVGIVSSRVRPPPVPLVPRVPSTSSRWGDVSPIMYPVARASIPGEAEQFLRLATAARGRGTRMVSMAEMENIRLIGGRVVPDVALTEPVTQEPPRLFPVLEPVSLSVIDRTVECQRCLIWKWWSDLVGGVCGMCRSEEDGVSDIGGSAAAVADSSEDEMFLVDGEC